MRIGTPHVYIVTTAIPNSREIKYTNLQFGYFEYAKFWIIAVYYYV